MLCVSANGSGEGQAPPEPLLSTVNGALEIVLVSGFVAVDDHGVRLAVALAAPQLSGLANGARLPPLKLNFSELKGSCGFSSKVVVSWPVVAFGSIVPFKRIPTPYLLDSTAT